MKAATLVLVDDAEFDLEVSSSHVVFANWAAAGDEVRLSCSRQRVSRSRSSRPSLVCTHTLTTARAAVVHDRADCAGERRRCRQ